MSQFTHTTDRAFFKSLDKTRPQLIEVASNPKGKGSSQKLWFVPSSNGLWDSHFQGQYDLNGVDYFWESNDWLNGNIPCRLVTEEKPTMKTIVFKSAYEFYSSDLWKIEEQTIQAWVESNPYKKGKRTKLKFKRKGSHLSSYFNGQYDIDGVDYAHSGFWHTDYAGTFTVEIPTTETVNYENIRPTPYKVGDWVEVLENVKECPKFNDWEQTKQNFVGKIAKIGYVFDRYEGVYYAAYINSPDDYYYFPHYCLKKTTPPPTPTKKRIKLRVTEEQIEQLKELGFLDKNNKSS